MPIGGLAIDDDDTRAQRDRGARVSTRSRKRLGGAQTRRRVENYWIW
jgi:hypothetical protein